MSTSPSLLDPQVLSRLQGLKIQVGHVVDGVLTGLHRSPRQGSSIDFAEHKAYSPGDDLRHLDWKVLARLDRASVRRYEDETQLSVFLLVDFSGSMGYASGAFSKARYASLLALSLAVLLQRQGDRVDLGLHQHGRLRIFPAGLGEEFVSDWAAQLEHETPQGVTALGSTLNEFLSSVRRRGLVLLFSDLFEPDESLVGHLKEVTTRGHSLGVFHVLDPDEIDFPFGDPTLFCSLEDTREVLTFPREIRREYLAEMGAFLTRLRSGLAAPRIVYETVRTDEPPHQPLLRFLSRRIGPGATARGGRP